MHILGPGYALTSDYVMAPILVAGGHAMLGYHVRVSPAVFKHQTNASLAMAQLVRWLQVASPDLRSGGECARQVTIAIASIML